METRIRDLRWEHVRLHAVHQFLRFSLRSRIGKDVHLERLGSESCGWWLPEDAAAPGAIAYCVGAGEDITFDLELLARGCRVTTFDPTPRAIAYVEGLDVEDERFRFVPIGLWDEADVLRFYIPTHNDYPNLSALNLHGSSEYVTAPVKPVAALMAELGDRQVDIMKLDVEGAEYRVLTDMLMSGVLPRVLCVEFDQPQPPRKTIVMVDRLVSSGYELARIDFFNYTFVR